MPLGADTVQCPRHLGRYAPGRHLIHAASQPTVRRLLHVRTPDSYQNITNTCLHLSHSVFQHIANRKPNKATLTVFRFLSLWQKSVMIIDLTKLWINLPSRFPLGETF